VIDNNAGNDNEVGTITLTEGWHDIRVEYWEFIFDAHLKLEMQGAETSDYIVVPGDFLKHCDNASPTWQEGLFAHYYDISGPIAIANLGPNPYDFKIADMDWTTVMRYWTRVIPEINYNDNTANPVGAWNANSQAIKFEGEVYVPEAGPWKFYTNSDDGSLLYINGALVVDNDGYHEVSEVEGEINLSAGWHQILVVYFDGIEHSRIEVRWVGEDSATYPKSIIPTSAFRHLGPGDLTAQSCPAPVDPSPVDPEPV
jgi:hypothetical protein